MAVMRSTNAGPLSAFDFTQKEIKTLRIEHVEIDTGNSDTDALLELFDQYELRAVAFKCLVETERVGARYKDIRRIKI